MSTSPVTPLPKEAVEFLDQVLAKQYLLIRLSEIPEFNAQWERVRQLLASVLEACLPSLTEYLKGLSPASRGALVAYESKFIDLYDDDARSEAAKVWNVINLPDRVLFTSGDHHVHRIGSLALVLVG